MTGFHLDRFVADARQAAAGPDPARALEALMQRVFAAPEAIAAAIPAFEEDEVTLFEDDSVSIWHERFHPHEVLPPHDHAMPAVIGVYRGRERNRLFRPSPDGTLAPGGCLDLSAGEIHVFGPRDVHTVQALDRAPSLGLHVYLGALTRTERSLYDWDNLRPIPMTGADFERLKRPA
jgi:predicted metal-dependent enzyme (double-stranded beta helix superfamily)